MPVGMNIRCKVCGKRPHELAEYISAAQAHEMTPDEYVRREEGTFNWATGYFYCTSCYVEIGMPLGKA